MEKKKEALVAKIVAVDRDRSYSKKIERANSHNQPQPKKGGQQVMGRH